MIYTPLSLYDMAPCLKSLLQGLPTYIHIKYTLDENDYLIISQQIVTLDAQTKLYHLNLYLTI